MTSPDLPPDAPASEPAGASAAPPAPAAPQRRWRWPARRTSLALAAAFLVGACLCGGVGLAVGAVASHGFEHASNEDGRGGGHSRDDNGGHRRGDDGRDADENTTPAPTTTKPSAPATTAAPTPTTSPS